VGARAGALPIHRAGAPRALIHWSAFPGDEGRRDWRWFPKVDAAKCGRIRRSAGVRPRADSTGKLGVSGFCFERHHHQALAVRLGAEVPPRRVLRRTAGRRRLVAKIKRPGGQAHTARRHPHHLGVPVTMTALTPPKNPERRLQCNPARATRFHNDTRPARRSTGRQASPGSARAIVSTSIWGAPKSKNLRTAPRAGKSKIMEENEHAPHRAARAFFTATGCVSTHGERRRASSQPAPSGTQI